MVPGREQPQTGPCRREAQNQPAGDQRQALDQSGPDQPGQPRAEGDADGELPAPGPPSIR